MAGPLSLYRKHNGFTNGTQLPIIVDKRLVTFVDTLKNFISWFLYIINYEVFYYKLGSGAYVSIGVSPSASVWYFSFFECGRSISSDLSPVKEPHIDVRDIWVVVWSLGKVVR